MSSAPSAVAKPGFGVRLTSGDRTYYSYSDDLSEADLQGAADAVSAALRGASGTVAVTNLGALRPARATAAIAVRPDTVATDVKAALLRAADDAARAADPAVTQVSAGYLESRQRLLVANSLGALVADDRTRVRFTVSAVARRDGVIQTGYESLGKSLGFEIVDEGIAQDMARAAAHKAITMLDARPAPTGPMSVVMGNGFGGTLFHEACGHGLEADGIAKGSSIYEGKIGDLVAAAVVNAYDDGTIAGEWGSAGVDDEGAPTQKTVVIERRPPARLSLRRPAGPRTRRRPNGQRPSPVVPPRAHPAHDAPPASPPATPPPTTSSPPPSAASTPRRWPAARSSRPAATSSSGWPRATS